MTSARYRLRYAQSAEDLRHAQELRHLAFYGAPGRDHDDFDARCQHILVEENGDLVACCRLLLCKTVRDINMSYSAQFYDFKHISEIKSSWLELGRLCLAKGSSAPNILRLIFAELVRQVEAQGVEMLFGCSSFQGTDPSPYQPALAQLARTALAPKVWAPRARALHIVSLETGDAPPNPREVMLTMPPLLRSYLLLGGKVSDHAVIDNHLNTLHVFTGVEVAAIPQARLRVLRALVE